MIGNHRCLSRRVLVGGAMASAVLPGRLIRAHSAPEDGLMTSSVTGSDDPAAAPVHSSPSSGPGRLQVLDGQNLRVDVGLHTDILAVVLPGTVVTVLSSPRFLDGYTWYEVFSPYGRGWLAADFHNPTTMASARSLD